MLKKFLWSNSTVTNSKFKESQDARIARKSTIFYRNPNIFTTPVSFDYIAAISRHGVETQWPKTKTETETWGYETETLKNVSHDIHLWQVCKHSSF